MQQTALHPYLSFNGNAREAIEFYQTVFGGTIELHTFKEFQASQDPSDDAKIMHAMLTSGPIVFMAADLPKGMEYKPFGGFSMSLSGGNEEELRGYFEKLSVGGYAYMPLTKAQWGDTFGMLSDKFGVNWMVNISAKQ